MKLLLFVAFVSTAALAQSSWSGKSTSVGSMSIVASNCGPPSYSCSRTDRALTNLPSFPPQAGSNICSGGQGLPSCGNLSGAGTIMTDSLYHNVKIVRFTDYTDQSGSPAKCPSGATIGPGGSAEENVFSKDDQLIHLSCGGGQEVFKVFNPATMGVGNYATSNGTSELELGPGTGGGSGDFSFVTPLVYWAVSFTKRQKYTFSVTFPNAVVSAGPITVMDGSHAIPCWDTISACPDWPGASANVVGGSNIKPSVGNSSGDVMQLIGSNSGGCKTGASEPAWNTSSTSELTSYTDGTCTWVDIGPPAIGNVRESGGVFTDDTGWVQGASNGPQGQGGNGACFIFAFNQATLTYSHFNTCTGNVYNTLCPVDYNCANEVRTYMGNAVPSMQALVRFHNVKSRCSQLVVPCWISVVPQACAASLQCPVSNGAPYQWQFGTTRISFVDGVTSAPGHKVSGYGSIIGSYGNNTKYFHKIANATLAIADLFDVGQGSPCTPTACPTTGPPFDQHDSWVADNLTDTAPVCSAALTHNYGNWPPTYSYQEELFCFATDGSNKTWRQGYLYDTGGSPGFSVWANIGSLSQDGKFWGETSDWWLTLGSNTGGTTCVGGFNWQASHTYNLNDVISPATNSGPVNGGTTYQVTACNGACTTGTSPPAWCNTAGCTVTDSNVTWTNHGAYTCRADVFLYQLQ